MALRIPVVIVDGELQQLQSGDTIGGTVSSFPTIPINPSADETVADGFAGYAPNTYRIADTFSLRIGNGSVFKIG